MNRTKGKDQTLLSKLSLAIVETIDECILILDEGLRVKVANRSFYETFQVDRQSTEETLIYELGNGQWDVPELRELLEKILPEKEILSGFEVSHHFPKLGRKFMLINARKLRTENGAEALILLTIDDITQEKRLQLERQEALKARDELVAVVSHELKNPLTTIISSLDILKKTLPHFSGRETADHLLAQIRSAAARMNKITSDLLDVSRIEAGQLRLQQDTVPTEDLLLEVIASQRVAAADKKIRIETEVAADARHAHYDRDRIFQVLTNLLNNAIKFTPDGGRIRVTAKIHDEMLRLEVIDTGCGIPESEMNHVFERFWQSKHRQYLGTGLGLYIAKNIVEAHGGRIGLDSRVGQGSTFYFMLPVRHIGCSSLET